jgi:mono/diheme cytochrome c family protein
LVNAPGHCAECHSPRNFLGGIVSKQRFAGGPDPEGGDGSVPNITQAGIGDYSDKDIALILATGEMPNGDSVGGAMTAVVRNTGQLAPEDRAAMAIYVKSLPPVEGPK